MTDNTEYTAIELLDHYHSESIMRSMKNGTTFKVTLSASEIGQLLDEIHALQEEVENLRLP